MEDINARAGRLSRLLKAYLAIIISLLTSISQWWYYKRLLHALHRRELTTSLQILEKLGVQDPIAQLSIIRTLQSEVAA